jgi:bifunctional non-homologous end joining protein LigD
VHKDYEHLKFSTRRGYDWSPRFSVLRDPLLRLKADAVILDGEVIVEAPNGTSDFGALESDPVPAIGEL